MTSTPADIDYKKLFNLIPERYVVFGIDPPGFTMLAANDAYFEVTGKGSDEVIGKKLFDVFPDTSDLAKKTGKGELRLSLDRVIESKQPDGMGVIRYDLNGPEGKPVERYWQAMHYPLFDDSGNLCAILQSTNDVTGLTQSQDKLKLAELHLDAALQAGLLGSWSWDISGNFVIVDEKLAKMFGVDSNEAIQGLALKRFSKAIDSRDRPRVSEAIQTSIKTGKDFEQEHRVTDSSGTTHWVISRGHVNYNSAKEAESFAGVMIDITHRKELESELFKEKKNLEARVKERTKQLQETNAGLRKEISRRKSTETSLNLLTEELKRSNEELKDFAYISSHDLQEPLRKIQAFGDLLVEEYGDQLGDGKLYLERMHNAATRMSVLIEDLLTYSRASTSKVGNRKIDLNQLVQDVLSDLDNRLKRESGIVDVRPLPIVRADETHMRQLFQNLISNGLKFHRPNVNPEVRIDYKEQDDTHVITFTDNGIGIDKKHAAKIFTVFQRLHSKKDYEGTGIGLSICKRIVERYHGTITVESSPGQGTTFTVILPKKGEDL